jgi:Putative DNA-binding domain
MTLTARLWQPADCSQFLVTCRCPCSARRDRRAGSHKPPRIPLHSNFRVSGRQDDKAAFGSQDRRYPLHYAAYEYQFQTSGAGQQANAPRGLVCALGLPIYPHAYAAIEHQLGVRVANQGTPELVALAPDYRARVKKVRLSLTGATVEIEIPEGDEFQILGKVYHENGHGAATHCDLSFESRRASFTATGYPRKMIVTLVSRDRGDAIDEWYYDSDQNFRSLGMPHDSGAEIEENEENLENLIQGGESETLEYKEKVPDKWALAATVTAFANSGGGRLLIGVTDSAEIVGCELEKLADRFTNIVHAHCEPAPAFTTGALTIRDTNIVVVNVATGYDKPYTVKDQGIYVRVGATTRRANRYEVDRLYSGKQAPLWR